MKKFRVSYYKTSEIEEGRAPRYIKDVDADTVLDAAKKVLKGHKDYVLRSAYRAPNIPISRDTNYVYMTKAARRKWWERTEERNKPARSCRICDAPVKRYKRICATCTEKKNNPQKLCPDCSTSIATSRRMCDDCREKRRVSQEIKGRLVEIKERVENHLKAAKDALAVADAEACINTRFYQGMRFPQCFYKHPCRSCLNTFITVQSKYLEDLNNGKVYILKSPHPKERVNRDATGKVQFSKYRSHTSAKKRKGARA
jgi:hypothetical protein